MLRLKKNTKLQTHTYDNPYWTSLRKEISPNVVEFHCEFCRILIYNKVYIFYIFLLTHEDEEAPVVIIFIEKLMAGCLNVKSDSNISRKRKPLEYWWEKAVWI